jgi:hypothetical protein
VYNLFSSFLDPTVTEEEIGRVYELTTQQVAAARVYVLSNPDIVLAEQMKIEERLASENPSEVREQAGRAKETFAQFTQWLAERAGRGAGAKGEGRDWAFSDVPGVVGGAQWRMIQKDVQVGKGRSVLPERTWE